MVQCGRCRRASPIGGSHLLQSAYGCAEQSLDIHKPKSEQLWTGHYDSGLPDVTQSDHTPMTNTIQVNWGPSQCQRDEFGDHVTRTHRRNHPFQHVSDVRNTVWAAGSQLSHIRVLRQPPVSQSGKAEHYRCSVLRIGTGVVTLALIQAGEAVGPAQSPQPRPKPSSLAPRPEARGSSEQLSGPRKRCQEAFSDNGESVGNWPG